VFLGDGILRNFPEFLEASPFRSEFEDKGVMSDYVQDIPTFLITAPDKTLWEGMQMVEAGWHFEVVP